MMAFVGFCILALLILYIMGALNTDPQIVTVVRVVLVVIVIVLGLELLGIDIPFLNPQF